MLFLSESIYERRRKLLLDLKAGKLTDEAFNRKLLELEPNDFFGLVGMGKTLRENGDLAGAEEHFWRAIQANPCGTEPYRELSRMYHSEPESSALATGLAELAILKQSREQDGDEFLKGIDEKAGLEGEVLEAFRELPAPARGRLIAASMREDRSDEPAPVTERLRPLRLIEQLQEGDLNAATIDAIIAEGPAIVPLLVGVLRAWAQDFLDDDDGDVDLENALALLGETGSPNEISYLLELVDLENATAAGASAWALGRIIERNPDESARFVESIVPGLGIAQRIVVAQQTTRYPAFDPSGKLLERLSGDLESIERDERDVFFPALLLAMVIARGRAGVSLGRAALRRQGGRLSRDTRRQCEDLLAACEEEGIPQAPPKPSPLTVYDICAGEATWDEEEDGEDEMEDEFTPPPEPVRRKATPGRNDPCWCNSGKKYKKCHLDSDERGGRQIP
jgi:hypothetical protein